jgi:hypothetical protein
VAGVGLDVGETPEPFGYRAGAKGPTRRRAYGASSTATEGDGQDMTEITGGASSRLSFAQAEVRAFPNDHLDDAMMWASGPAR